MAPAVTVSDLVIRRGRVTAVAGISLTVDGGEVVALLGPNGAGKTTTVEAVAGLLPADSGSVVVLGADPAADRARITGRVGVMPQDGGVHPGIRVSEAVRLHAALHDRPADPGRVIEQVGLTQRAGATWRALSGGERQRLSLALALVGRPAVALLDEPTSGVDPAGRARIRSLVADQARAGVAVLVTTHELDEAERMADRVVIIDAGRVVAAGRPEELAGDVDDVRFAAPAGLDVAALGAAVGADVDELAPGRYRVAAPPTPATVAAVTSWLAEREIPLGDLQAGRRRLEEVYLRLTGEGG